MASLAETHTRVNEQENKEESFAYAMQLVTGSVLPMTLQAATELGIFEIIAKAGPGAKLSASEIAAQMSAKNQGAPLMLDRILRLLTTHRVLGCSLLESERFYSLAPVAKHFVCNEDGVSLGPLLLLIQDKVFLDSWSELKDAVLEGGIPFDRVHGTHVFEYTGLNPRFNQVFNTAMYKHTTVVIKDILDSYKGLEILNKLIDVGGGLGVTLKVITAKYPHIKGINFDLPHVIQNAPSYPGVEHVGGDMFESIPKGEAILMKWILHGWSDDHCLKLLKNCYNAIPDDGKVIVVDAVLPVVPEIKNSAKAASQMDMFLMTQSPGGKERTRDEFMALATSAGFSGIRYECFVCNLWVMEFFK